MVQLPMIYSLFLSPLKWLEMVQLPMKNILFSSPLKRLEMSPQTGIAAASLVALWLNHTPPIFHQLT